MRKIKLWHFLIVFSLLTLIAFKSPVDRFFAISQSMDLFASVFKEVTNLYVDEIDPDQLSKVAFDAMLESLDPYTNFIPEEDTEAFISSTTGEYAGIGAQIAILDKSTYIIMLYEGFAAQKSGLEIGDNILSINGQNLQGKSVGQISTHLKGKNRTKLILQIGRNENKDTLEYEIQREKITIKNIPYYSILPNSNTGYIYLEGFTSGAGKEVQLALNDLKDKGAKSLILDLRNNPGGLLSEAVNVANCFIPKNKAVVSTRGKIKEWNRTYKTLNSSIDEDIPLAVLINSESASAAEIVAGVIQDYDRGILIGQQSFGKGLVQTTRPLTHNTTLKVTTARYFIPSGRCIQSLDYHDYENASDSQKVDSTRHIFKTKSGREVYDKGGLIPDLITQEKRQSLFIQKLISEGYLFLYINKIMGEKRSDVILDFNNADFENFVSWLIELDFHFESIFESQLNILITSAKDEKYYDVLTKEISIIKQKSQTNLKKELLLNKAELINQFKSDMASRTDFQSGMIGVSLESDSMLLFAQENLNNRVTYSNLLSKK
jgi:carboxyl-terminal processing protease